MKSAIAAAAKSAWYKYGECSAVSVVQNTIRPQLLAAPEHLFWVNFYFGRIPPSPRVGSATAPGLINY